MKRPSVRTRLRRSIAVLAVIGLSGLGLQLGATTAHAALGDDTITGQVLNDMGTPAIGIVVQTAVGGSTTTDEHGNYEFSSLPDDLYQVTFTGNSAYTAASTASFLVQAGSTTAPTLTVHYVPGTLAGRVTNYDGTSSITVRSAEWDTHIDAWVALGASSDVLPDGTWMVHPVHTAGDYRLLFTVNDARAPYFTTYYGDTTIEFDGGTSGGGNIQATANETIDTLQVTMASASFVTGTVRFNGAPLSGINVDAWDPVADVTYDAEAPTTIAGTYSIKVPPSTNLEVETDGAEPYEYQVWNGHNGCDCTYDPVNVGPGLTKAGIDFNLILSGDPITVITILIGDDGSTTPEPLPGGTIHLYRAVKGGYSPAGSQVTDSTAEADFSLTAAGTYRIRVSYLDPSTHKSSWYPIETYAIIDPNNPSDVAPVTPPGGTCTLPLGALHPGDERAVIIEITDNTTQCGGEPAIAHPSGVAGHHTTVTTSVVTTATPTPIPTGTATPTPSPTPSSSPSKAPSAGIGLAPQPASSPFPWWGWLLIVVGILILLGIGIAIFRTRT